MTLSLEERALAFALLSVRSDEAAGAIAYLDGVSGEPVRRILKQTEALRGKRNEERVFQRQLVKEICRKLKDSALEANNERTLVDCARLLGKVTVGSGLRTSQLRKFLTELTRHKSRYGGGNKQEFKHSTLAMLEVQLAYAAARQNSAEPVRMVVQELIGQLNHDGVEGYEQLSRLHSFVQGLVAFHGFYGGKDREGT